MLSSMIFPFLKKTRGQCEKHRQRVLLRVNVWYTVWKKEGLSLKRNPMNLNLERRLRRYAIGNLMKYICLLYTSFSAGACGESMLPAHIRLHRRRNSPRSDARSVGRTLQRAGSLPARQTPACPPKPYRCCLAARSVPVLSLIHIYAPAALLLEFRVAHREYLIHDEDFRLDHRRHRKDVYKRQVNGEHRAFDAVLQLFTLSGVSTRLHRQIRPSRPHLLFPFPALPFRRVDAVPFWIGPAFTVCILRRFVVKYEQFTRLRAVLIRWKGESPCPSLSLIHILQPVQAAGGRRA